MSMTLVIVLNAILDLGIVAGLAAVMSIPFRLDRRLKSACVPVEAASRPLFDVDLAA